MSHLERRKDVLYKKEELELRKDVLLLYEKEEMLMNKKQEREFVNCVCIHTYICILCMWKKWLQKIRHSADTVRQW